MYNNSVEIAAKNSMLRKVFLLMFLGLFVTGASSMFVVTNSAMTRVVYSYPQLIMIFELALVLFINFRINKISSGTATFLFFLYSAANGLLLSVIMFMYSTSAIIYVLLVTMIIFIVMTLYGLKTKEDLSSYGSFFRGALIALVIVSIINIFLKVSVIAWGLSVFAIVLFTALIAYDVNRITRILDSSNFSEEDYNRFAIIGALNLYLDFINLFLNLLRIFGKKR